METENMTIEAVDMIPKANHDAMMARMERMNTRLFALAIILIVCLLGTNIGWLVYESSFEDVVTLTQTGTAEADGDVILNGTAEGNVTYYGESNPDNNQKTR